MSKYETRPLTLNDLRVLTQATPEAKLWDYMQARHVEHLLEQDSWSGFVDAQLVACGGVVSIWPGLAEAWIAVTPFAKQHTAFVYRTCKLYLKDRIDRLKLNRVEAHIRADFKTAFLFAHALGFKYEADLKGYGPNGETFLLMSKVM